MTKPNHAQAHGGTPGRSRKRRRPTDGGPAWFRPFCRAHRALDSSVRLIGATLRTVAGSERCAHRRPIRTSRNLHQASALLVDASARLARAARELAETNECVAREPERATAVPDMLVHATERWMEVAILLQRASIDVSSLHEEVLLGLATGALVPERPAGRRPRIVLAPRPVSAIRAFLLLRQVRVVDRIAPLLRRRRRTPRPAAVRVPRRNLLGRAPPLFPIPVS